MHCGSKTDTPKAMVGVPVLKLLRQWPVGVLAPPPMLRTSFTMTKRFICSGGRVSQPTTDRGRRERIELPDWVPVPNFKK